MKLNLDYDTAKVSRVADMLRDETIALIQASSGCSYMQAIAGIKQARATSTFWVN